MSIIKSSDFPIYIFLNLFSLIISNKSKTSASAISLATMKYQKYSYIPTKFCNSTYDLI